MIFEIEQYEVHVQRYRVEANSGAEAIARLYQGEADPIDNSLEYVEVADEYGMPVDQNQEVAEQLRNLGITVGEDIIPSVRTIEKVE
jgi:hypothetical protein